MWPQNKTICLIKQFMFLGLRTSHADKWGQGPRFFRQSGSAMDSEQFECQPPVMLGLPFHLCFGATPLISATSTKRGGCLKLLCCPCTFIPMTKQLSYFPKPHSPGELGWLLTILHLSGPDLSIVCENLLSLSGQ